MNKSRRIAAAWIPERSDMDWENGSMLAADWTQARCDEEELPGLLLVHAQSNNPHERGALGRFAARNSITAVNSQSDYSTREGPVLAYCPSPKDLALAMDLAVDSALCVIEGTIIEWTGWAIEMQAVDLLTGEVTPDPRTDDQRQDFQQLDLYANNAFGDYASKGPVPRMLQRLMAGSGGLSPEIIYGMAVARGADERGVKNLKKYVDRL